jgi:hypothetical protein
MRSTSEKSALFSAFKSILKERKLTYKDLAKRTHSSESSIKRIFSIEECSLTRLTDLLASVDITLSELMEYASQRKVDIASFSPEVEEFFAKHLDCFFIYRKLFHHRSVEEVRRRQKLSAAQMSKYLRKLDDLKIIKWLPNDRIQFLLPEFLKFRDDGPLKAAVYKSWGPKFHQLVISKMGDADHNLRLMSVRCTPELKESFSIEFEAMIARFVKRASLEVKTQPSRVRPLAISLASGPFRIGLDEQDK